jgi:hypothetical protein
MEPLQNRTEGNSPAVKFGEKVRSPFKTHRRIYWRLVVCPISRVYRVLHWLMECEYGVKRKRLLFHHFIIWLIRRNLGTKKRKGQGRRASRYGPLLRAKLVCHHSCNGTTNHWPVECRPGPKRERLLCHGILLKHVLRNCCTKKYPRRKNV